MKILFFIPDYTNVRKAEFSYSSLELGGGFSGTETAILEMAKHLADYGNDVTIAGVNRTHTDHGVKFIRAADLSKRDFDVDWYSPLFFLNDDIHKSIVSRLDPNRTKIFVWFHCFIEDRFILDLKRKFVVYGQYLCRYVADEYTKVIEPSKSWIIYNGVSGIFKDGMPVSSAGKRGNWVFHAVHQRGGEMAKQVFRRVRASQPAAARKMTIMSYHINDIKDQDISSGILYAGSKGKLEVRNILLESDYFVYPLVLPDGRVHHDTFGSVMLEALACGVIVITWDVACISEIYKDNVIKIPVPSIAHKGYDPRARYGQCPWMLTAEAQQLFVDVISDLEKDPKRKERQREQGMRWARTITWDKLAAEMEENLAVHHMS